MMDTNRPATPNLEDAATRLHLTHLGKQSVIETDPDKVVLDLIPNPQQGLLYVCRFTVPEFSSLCVAGNTLIDVACNEIIHPNGIPIKDLVDTEGLVFSYDEQKSEPVVRRYYDVRKTRENVDTVRVNFRKRLPSSEGGSYSDKVDFVELTSDHLVLIRRGFRAHEWVAAGNLQPGDRFIADQRSGDNIRGKGRHRLIAEYIEDRQLEHEEHAHHVNHNHFDNRPENICVLRDSEHISYHRTSEYGYEEKIDIDVLVAEYHEVKNIKELARRYNCDCSTITSRLKGRVDFYTQSEALSYRNSLLNKEAIEECVSLYTKGYTTYEIAEYFGLHTTAVTGRLRKAGVAIRESNFSRKYRRSLDLPALNHRVESIEVGERQDVYNMEVEDTHCFFGNNVVLHNCPATGQPDFAVLIIDYMPDKFLVESKALKLYMFAHRNHGAFHEDVTVSIGKRLAEAMDPHWFRIAGFWNGRGGISIDVVWEAGSLPPNIKPLSIDNVKLYTNGHS